MRGLTSFVLAFLLIVLLAACTLPDGPGEVPQSEEPGEEKAAEIDYCDLPGGTRLTWFDLSSFIFIPETQYMMGMDAPDLELDHEPAHPVNLTAFWMHETEVSNRQFANCVAAGQCEAPASFEDVPYWYGDVETLDEPVVGVTWEQAQNYCTWIGTRLPTEAEWELAARGMQAAAYPWGETDPDCDLANYANCLDPDPDEPVITGSLPGGVSPFEMLDMAGNVSEWVADWYALDYYQSSPSTNPLGPETGELRVFRGGGYQSPAEDLLSYLRGAAEPVLAQQDVGFRCAWSCGESVPPKLCQLPAVFGGNPQVGDQPKPQNPGISGMGYCELRASNQAAGVVLEASEGIDLSQYDVSSPNGPVNCDMVGEKLVCHGGAIKPANNVSLKICPDCSPGFYFDQESGFCKQMIGMDPDYEQIELGDGSPCPEETIWIPQLGCIPSGAPQFPSCEPGYYYTSGCGCIPLGVVCQVVIEPTPVDAVVVEPTPVEAVVIDPNETPESGGGAPADSFFDVMTELSTPVPPGQFGKDPGLVPYPKPEDCGSTEILGRCPPEMSIIEVNGCRYCWPFPDLADCPDGYILDPEAQCCVPEVPVPVCPAWTYYDPASNLCLPISFGKQTCFEITVFVPVCPTATPKPRCSNPSQYKDQNSCEAANCQWYKPYPTRPGQCIQP